MVIGLKNICCLSQNLISLSTPYDISTRTINQARALAFSALGDKM